MKLFIKWILQSILGVDTYLFLFAWVKIATLRWDQKEGEFWHFLELVSEDGHVLDIGANIGVMTVLLAQQARHGMVHAFEPMPVNFGVLERVVSRSGLTNVTTYPWALGATYGTVEMFMPVERSVVLHGLSHVINKEDTEKEGSRAKVPCWRLDDLVERFASGLGVTAIKIDVEGYEHAVFAGARQLIASYRPAIYCEIGSNPQRSAIFEMFHELNYAIQVQVKGKLVDFDPAAHSHKWNFFFLPRQPEDQR
jgi:FkbM family methyltransferase